MNMVFYPLYGQGNGGMGYLIHFPNMLQWAEIWDVDSFIGMDIAIASLHGQSMKYDPFSIGQNRQK